MLFFIWYLPESVLFNVHNVFVSEIPLFDKYIFSLLEYDKDTIIGVITIKITIIASIC